MVAATEPGPSPRSGDRGGAVTRIGAGVVFAAMLVAALSLWTLIPFGWVYVGSKLSESQFPSMGPYLIVAAGILVSVVAVGLALARLSALYEQITGTNRGRGAEAVMATKRPRRAGRARGVDRGRSRPRLLGAPRRGGPGGVVLRPGRVAPAERLTGGTAPYKASAPRAATTASTPPLDDSTQK